MATGFRARVLVAEDEEFTLNLLREVLEGANFQVEAVTSVAQAIALVGSFDPHVVITDLNFGMGPSGADLLQFVEKEHPWVGKVVLTSHASPALAIPNGVAIPTGVTYLVKSAIARKRGTSLRATETLVQRTFASLGIKSDEDFNPRVLAVRMWQQGKVVIK
jgi:DNA-binding NtrC family response regulator